MGASSKSGLIAASPGAILSLRENNRKKSLAHRPTAGVA